MEIDIMILKMRKTHGRNKGLFKKSSRFVDRKDDDSLGLDSKGGA
jgi:hypothetical protein